MTDNLVARGGAAGDRDILYVYLSTENQRRKWASPDMKTKEGGFRR